MISQNLEESNSVPAENAVDGKRNSRSRRLKPLISLWKRGSRENNSTNGGENASNEGTNKISLGFFRNIKRHMQIKNLTACRSRRKIKDVEGSALSHGTNSLVSQNARTIGSCKEQSLNDLAQLNVVSRSEESVKDRELDKVECRLSLEKDLGSDEEAVQDQCDGSPLSRSTSDTRNIEPQSAFVRRENEVVSEANDARETTDSMSRNEVASNENKVKVSLTEELLKLSKYGWYWGPISGDEADAKLISEPDGAFLVRDSSDDRYVLTLSFKSSGKLLHARLEHSGGLFSLCNQGENERFSSVADLINHSMIFSQSAVFCYSRPKYPGYPSFPVRLTKPVSRFTQVRSLQYLCRFVIRQNTRLDNIHKLPLPKSIKGYIEEAHY